jgi:hypothetical protein
MGRCGGDGRRHQAHEVVKLAFKRLVLNSLDPGSHVFLDKSVLIEPRHLRHDMPRPGDVYAIGKKERKKSLPKSACKDYQHVVRCIDLSLNPKM